MTDDHHIPEGADGLREHFEANMLDGDAIQAGQMLASESVFEYVSELIEAEHQRIYAAVERILGGNDIAEQGSGGRNTDSLELWYTAQR